MCNIIRKFFTFILTSIALLGLNFGISILFNVSFVDYSFFVGLLGAVFVYFFSSSGGFSRNNLDMLAQATTGFKMETSSKEEKKFHPSTAFYTSILYTVIAAIILFYTYKEYF